MEKDGCEPNSNKRRFPTRWPYHVLGSERSMRSSAMVSVEGATKPAIGKGVSETWVRNTGDVRASEGGCGWRNPFAITAAVRAVTDGQRIKELERDR